jgi:hypothetical protein
MIQEELKKWASDAYKFYDTLAYDLDMDYYTQSDLSLITDRNPVKLMVIGINPGYGGKYQPKRFSNSEDLLLGNYDPETRIHENIKDWKIIKNLRKVLDYGGLGELLDSESSFVFTNATFFSTHDEKGLAGENIKSAQLKSVKYTKDLIKKIHPRHIICLGGKNCTDLIVESTKPLLSELVKLDFGKIDDIPVYGINHTSSFWSSEEMELIGKSLGLAFSIDQDDIDVTDFEKKMIVAIDRFQKRRNDRDNIKLEGRLRWQYIYACLNNFCEYQLHLEKAEYEHEWTRSFIKDSDGKNILKLALINQANEKAIGITYLEKNQDKSDDFDLLVSTIQSIDHFNPYLTNQGKVGWIGYLKITNKLKDTDLFISEIKLLLRDTVSKLSSIL